MSVLSHMDPKLGDTLAFAQKHRQGTFQAALRISKTVRVYSRDTIKSPERKTQQHRVLWVCRAGRVMCRQHRRKKKTLVRSVNRVSREGSTSVSTVFSSDSRQVSPRPLSLGQLSLLVVRSIAVRKTPSTPKCLVLRVDPFQLIILTAIEESQHRICDDVGHVFSQTFATSSTAVEDPLLHRLQIAQQPTQRLRC